MITILLRGGAGVYQASGNSEKDIEAPPKASEGSTRGFRSMRSPRLRLSDSKYCGTQSAV
jgi:hypothetical protein